MNILWVKEDFVNQRIGGGSIRTLGILRWLNARHEIHYVAFADRSGDPPDTSEYCYRSYAVQPPLRAIPSLCTGVPKPLPEGIRHPSEEMRCLIEALIERRKIEVIVCDFPHVALSLGCRLPAAILFQHNVEHVIPQRMAGCSVDEAEQRGRRELASRMYEYEKWLCNSVSHVIASSPVDAELIKGFGTGRVSWVPTGVDLEYYRKQPSGYSCDIAFVGAMNWSPNQDAVLHFVENIFPLILQKRPATSFNIVGRDPPDEIRNLSNLNPAIHVTGTVDDVRPWLWSAKVAAVPLRAGSGTRLKIYEAMAAAVPVVSTSIGAEGLDVEPFKHILIADDPSTFAEYCVQLMDQPGYADQLASSALAHLQQNYSWDIVAEKFERELLLQVAKTSALRWMLKNRA